MKDLVIVDKDGQQAVIPVEEVKKYIAPNATDAELWMYMGICRAYNLNPLKREIHFVKYKSRDGKDTKTQVIIGYEVYLKRAMATGKLEWWNVTVEGETAAEMEGVFKAKRSDWTEPFEWRVPRSEFDKNQSTWKVMPKFLLKKCAIGQGLRLLFPEELGGMPYSPEEINGHTSEQINNASVVDVEFEDAPEIEKVEPEEDEKAKVLEAITKKIGSFKTIEKLEEWAKGQSIEESILKNEILAALAEKRKALEPAVPEKAEPSEMSEADQLLAQIREVLEAQGHDPTYIENRLHGLGHQKADGLRQALATVRKQAKNGGKETERADINMES